MEHKERPIPFSAPMVRAILAGSKTQTRRPLKGPCAASANENKPGQHAPIKPYTNGRGSWNFVLAETGHGLGDPFPCPYGVPGDRLWVREAWRAPREFDTTKPSDLKAPADGLLGTPIVYEASRHVSAPFGKLRPGMFMPRWASRITLEVTGVRVERLQDISTADCWAEGIAASPDVDPVHEYRELWESINGPGSWDANPWVWVVEFRKAQEER